VQAQVHEHQQQEQQRQDEVDIAPVMPTQAEQQLGLLRLSPTLKAVAMPAAGAGRQDPF